MRLLKLTKKILKYCINRMIRLKHRIELFFSLHLPPGRRTFIIGSPVYTNLGDSAIYLAERSFIAQQGCEKKRIKEITYSEFYQFRKDIRKTIKSSEPIFCLGGGNMGNQWPPEEKIRYDIINDFPRNPIVVFPQTIFFLDNSEKQIRESIAQYNISQKLILIAREKQSFEIMTQLYPKIKTILTPDIVLSASMEDFGAVREKRSGVLVCARSDVEKSLPDAVWDEIEDALAKDHLAVRHTDMYSDRPVTKKNRAECVRKKMQEFCGAELVITDRLHGMVFAALTGTPCIVFSNYNHKVKGTYDWISYLPYVKYAETAEEAIAYIPALLQMKNCHYDGAPLAPSFEKLADAVKASQTASK